MRLIYVLLKAHAGNTVLEKCPVAAPFKHVLDSIALVRCQKHVTLSCLIMAEDRNNRPINKFLNTYSGIVCL